MGVLDSTNRQEWGDLRLNHTVITTPGPLRDAVAVGVSHFQATLRWRSPLNDYGAPVMGYRVDLLDEDRNGRPVWVPFFETSRLQAVAERLQPGTFYNFRVSAVNRAGSGDPCEFSFVTLPMPEYFGHTMGNPHGQLRHVEDPQSVKSREHG